MTVADGSLGKWLLRCQGVYSLEGVPRGLANVSVTCALGAAGYRERLWGSGTCPLGPSTWGCPGKASLFPRNPHTLTSASRWPLTIVTIKTARIYGGLAVCQTLCRACPAPQLTSSSQQPCLVGTTPSPVVQTRRQPEAGHRPLRRPLPPSHGTDRPLTERPLCARCCAKTFCASSQIPNAPCVAGGGVGAYE